MRRNLIYVWTAAWFKLRGWLFFKNYILLQNRPDNYRHSLLQNTPGVYNMTCDGFHTKQYLQVICMLKLRAAGFSIRNCKQNLAPNAKNHGFHNFASPTAISSTHGPTRTFSCNFPGCIVPAKQCAVISSMFGRWGFQTARFDFSKNTKNLQNHPYN